MLNNRDEKYQGQEPEESEYHFSDDDVSYEVENESPTQAKSAAAASKPSVLGAPTQSKRMIISLLVFLILVYIVYKMVAPTTSVTASDVASQPIVAEQAPQAAVNKPQQTVAATPAQPAATPQPVATVEISPDATPAATAPTVAAAPQPVPSAPVATQPAPAGDVPVSPSVAASTAVTPPVTQPQQVPSGTVPVAVLPQQPEAIPAQAPSVASMPSVIPVQTATPTYPVAQQEIAPVVVQAPPAAIVQPNNVQQPNELAAENKMLQDQLQLLNSRVANIETQMNQLMQVLNRQQNQPADNTMAEDNGRDNDGRMMQSEAPAQTYKINYSVQAIIPGRAWLRSESGETITVAEGDVIKDVGRVTKIDPYDGVVEINVGNKVVSLSYGTNG